MSLIPYLTLFTVGGGGASEAPSVFSAVAKRRKLGGDRKLSDLSYLFIMHRMVYFSPKNIIQGQLQGRFLGVMFAIFGKRNLG